MKEFEKELIKDDKLRKLVLKHFKKINKIKKDNINEFITKYKEELDEISTKKNWKLWLLGINKKYIKMKEDDDGKGVGLKKDKSDSDSLSDEMGKGKKEKDKTIEKEEKRRKKEIQKL